MPIARGVIVVEPDQRRRIQAIAQIKRIAGYPVVCACQGRRDTLQKLREPIDFALVNMQLPDGSGADLIRFILKKNPHCRVLVLTDVAEEKTVMQAVLAGASGYMLFADQDLDIIACFELMDRGGSPISQAVSQSFLRALACRGQGGSAPADSPLSGRETEVLRLVAKGLSYKQIAERLVAGGFDPDIARRVTDIFADSASYRAAYNRLLALSRNTVISHAKSIYRKLDVHSRAEALAAAASRRLLG